MPRRPKTLTAERLWQIPRVGSPVASPDGLSVAVGVTTHDSPAGEPRTRTWLFTGNKPHPLTRPDEDASPAAFSPDSLSLALIRQVPREGKDKGRLPQIAVLNLRGGEAPTLTHMPLGAHNPRFLPDGSLIFSAPLLAEAPTVDGTRKLLAEREGQNQPISTESRLYRFWDHWIAGGKVIHIFRLPAEGGTPTDLTPRFHRILEFMSAGAEFELSPDGRKLAFNAPKDRHPFTELRGGVWLLDLGRKGAVPKLLTARQGWSCSGGIFSPDGRHLVYGMQVRPHFYAEQMRLVALDLKTGRHRELTHLFDRSPSQWLFDAEGKLVISAEDNGRHSLWKLEFRKALSRPMAPRKTVTLGHIGPLSAGGRRLYASVDSHSRPPELQIFEGSTHRNRKLSSFTAESLGDVKLGAVRSIWFRGAKGDRVRMFLASPPGLPSQARRPLVHFIHGGPHGTFGDQWHWRWNPHVVAARGYRVAMVNFHGSSSFGNDFCASILGRWGDLPFEDIEKASDLLVLKGFADPRRLAVTGGSYGGYLTSWICSQTNRYRCAISHAGVNDLQSHFATDVAWGRPTSLGGDVWRNIGGLDRNNPMRHAAGFRTPMLITHGEKDYRVPYTLGLELYNVLKAKGVPARLAVYPDENHWILKKSNSLHWHQEFLDWLDRWLGRSSVQRHRRRM